MSDEDVVVSVDSTPIIIAIPTSTIAVGVEGTPGPPGEAGPPTTLYVQPDPPDLGVPPGGFPLWLDTDDVPASAQGNLLTANQASMETDTSGWQVEAALDLSVSAAVADHGTKSLKLTQSGGDIGYMSASTLQGAAGVPVVSGSVMTVAASARAATAGRQWQLAIFWYTAAGAFISQASSGNLPADSTTAWARVQYTATAPYTAASMAVAITFVSPAPGEVHYVDRVGTWHGAGGEWDMPGAPSAGMGVLKYTVDGAAWQGLQAGPAGPEGPKGDPGTPGSPGAPGAPGAAGATILSGTATPTGAVGALGDYYLDTDDRMLYGPKAVSVIGPPQSITITTTNYGPGNSMFGQKYRFLTAGYVRGISVFVVAAHPAASWEVYLYSSTGTLLASKDGPLVTAITAYNEVLFDTPVPVVAGQTYMAAYWLPTGSGYGAYLTNSVLSNSGQTTGDVRLLATGEDGPHSTYGTTRDVYPSAAAGATGIYPGTPVFTVAPPEWPVALKSIPPGGSTGQFLKKTSGSDFAVGWVT